MAALTDAVKRHLKITWTSVETAAEVEDIMDRAGHMLNDMLGAELDYDPDSASCIAGRDRDLYLNLCLYLYNGLTEPEFMEAYGASLNIARQFHVDPIDTEDQDEDQ